MKKILKLMIVITLSLTLMACSNTIEDNTFSVVFYTDGGSHVETVYKINKGSKITKPEDPTKDGGIFAGWYKEPSLESEWKFEVDIVEKSTTLYAKWELAEFTITYDLNGGQFPADLPSNLYPTKYTIDSANIFVKPSLSKYFPIHPSKSVFIGWWDKPGLTYDERRDPKNPQITMIAKGTTGDITLYAYYTGM